MKQSICTGKPVHIKTASTASERGSPAPALSGQVPDGRTTDRDASP